MYAFLVILSAATGSPPASLRDAPLDKRCEAFFAFVKTLGVEPTACGEGNGIGGAQYSVDFKVGKEAKGHRVDVLYGDHGKTETRVEPANTGLDKLKSDVHAWASAKPAKRTIFDTEYGAYLRKIVAYKGDFPTTGKPIKLKLKPDSDGSLSAGAAEVLDEAPADFMKCLGCDDQKCATNLRYRFEDRFFWVAPKDQKGKPFGAGWIIDAPEPTSGSEAWDFLCGVSRYSLSRTF